MANGDSGLLGAFSYFGLGRETTVGTYNTCPSSLDFLSTSLKTQKDSKILEQIERSRTYSKRLQLGKTVGGDVGFYLAPLETAQSYIFQNAFGGTATVSTATSETTNGLGFQTVFSTGNMDQSAQSLCLNVRKGPVTSGRIWEYSGIRVDTLGISAQLDEPVMVNVGFVGMDSSQTTNDLESVYTATANECLSFVNARISVEGTFASLTSTSFWHVQSFDFSLSNNLKSGNESRRIGSDTLNILPPGIQSYELSCQMLFNTTTAYDAMIAGTEYGLELEMLGSTMATSTIRQGLLLEFQKVAIKDAGDPEISGPDGLLTANVTFDVLRDESASGYACQATLTNTHNTATMQL
jgi:hypothetical protein